MAVPISPENSAALDVDGLLTSTSVTSIWKRAVDGTSITPTNSNQNAGAEMVGTHIPGEVLAATDPVVLLGGHTGGTVWPLEAGTAVSGTALVLHVRETGPAVSLVAHAINVTTGTASVGTGITSGRKHIEFYNGGTTTVYLGPSTVGTATGFPLGTAAYANFNSGHAWHATTTAGTASLRVLEMS